MFAIAISNADGTLRFVRRSTPTCIDWTNAIGFAKKFKTEDEALRSHDHARTRCVTFWTQVVPVGGAKQ